MKCPTEKCTGQVLCEESVKGVIFNRKRVRMYYCPMCRFRNPIEFPINEDTYQEEIKKINNGRW